MVPKPEGLIASDDPILDDEPIEHNRPFIGCLVALVILGLSIYALIGIFFGYLIIPDLDRTSPKDDPLIIEGLEAHIVGLGLFFGITSAWLPESLFGRHRYALKLRRILMVLGLLGVVIGVTTGWIRD